MEVWKDVVGFEGIYSVSNLGRVRRDLKERNTYAGKIKKLSLGKDGYLHMGLSRKGKSYNKRLHNLIAEAFIGKRPLGLVVDHIDRNKLNNNVDNLRYITPQQNMKNVLTIYKISEDIVNKVVNEYKAGHSQISLGKKYKISNSTISRYVNGSRRRKPMI